MSDLANPAHVERVIGCSHTEYRITGELPAVFEGIQSLFINYHPHGYGTHVHGLSMNNDGSYTARVSRLNSCD